MKTVCEVVVQDILPTLRAAIAKELIANYNMSQVDAAKLLDVSQPAISQYLRQLRGKNNITDNKAVHNEIKNIAGKLHAKEISAHDLATHMCSLSRTVIDSGILKIDKFHAVDTCMVCNGN